MEAPILGPFSFIYLAIKSKAEIQSCHNTVWEKSSLSSHIPICTTFSTENETVISVYAYHLFLVLVELTKKWILF